MYKYIQIKINRFYLKKSYKYTVPHKVFVQKLTFILFIYTDLCSEVSKSKKPKTGFEDSTKKQQTSSSNILKKKKKFKTSFVTPMSQPLPSLHTDSKPANPQIEKSPEPKVISRRGVNLNPELIPQVEICVAEEEVEEVKTVSYNDVLVLV